MTQRAVLTIETSSDDQVRFVRSEGIRRLRGGTRDTRVHGVPGEARFHLCRGASARMLAKPFKANKSPSARMSIIITMPKMNPFIRSSL